MKYIKLLMLIVAVSFFASCSDDDDYNTQEATVSFKEAVTVTKENAGLIQIPIYVDGKQRNGDITFRIEMEPTGVEPAVADSMYYLTSSVFRIPADSLVKSVNVEIKMLDDRIPTEPREFNINIVQCNGAQLGLHPTTKVQILDNDGDEYTYDSMFGKYALAFNFKGNDFNVDAEMSGALFPEDFRYNKELELNSHFDIGIGTGAAPYKFPMAFAYDRASNAGTLGIKMGSPVMEFPLNEKTVLQWILLNSEKGQEDKPVNAPFNMEKAQLLDANGNVVVNKNGEPITYNVPSNMTFEQNKVNFIQVTATPDMTGVWGAIVFKTLNYKR